MDTISGHHYPNSLVTLEGILQIATESENCSFFSKSNQDNLNLLNVFEKKYHQLLNFVVNNTNFGEVSNFINSWLVLMKYLKDGLDNIDRFVAQQM